MKKFSIKTMLAVVLVLVLVLSLVACGDKCKNGHLNENQDRKCDRCGKEIPACGTCVDADGNNKCDVCGSRVSTGGNLNSDSAKFFQNLWDSAQPIGGTAIEEGEDLAVSMDMSLALGNGGDILADLGINIGLVLDRTTDGAHSAAKIAVYDHEHNENLLTVFYFLDDNDVFYIDALDQSFQVAVDYNYNDQAAGIINDAINKKLKDLLGEETVASLPNIANKSIMDIIDNLVEDFGAAWNLDAPINAITGLLGIDITELIAEGSIAGILDFESLNDILIGIADGMVKNGVTSLEGYEGIDLEALAESDAVILDLLKGVAPIVFPEVETSKNGNATTYKTELDLSQKGIIGKLMLFIGNLPMGIGQLITDMEEVSLQYTTEGNEISNFGINVILGTEDDTFDIGIRINDLSIQGVNAAQAETVLGANKEEYAPYFEINTGMEIEVSEGALIVNVNGARQDFKGTYTMALRGQIDLVNVENNATRVLATIMHDGKEMARLTFDGTALALGVDASSPVVKFIVEEGVSLLLQGLAEANQVDGQPDTWLRGLVLTIANAAFTQEFADAAALKAATEFTIDPALSLTNGVAITDISLSDIKTHGERLINAAIGAIGGMLGGSESAGVEDDLNNLIEQAWEPNIYTLLSALSEAIDGNIKDGLTAEVENVGELIVSLFGTTKDGQTGPLDIEELCYGNGKTINGIFTMVDGWDACAWATEVFGECAWAGDDILMSLMESGIEVELKSDLSGSVKLINGDCYISVSFNAGITASDSEFNWSNVSFPDVTTWATYQLN